MTGKKPFLTVYGHVTIDQIASVGKFPDINETVDIIDKKTSLGGTGTNIAMTAAKLGVPTALCAFVGMDFPERYRREMEDCGLIMDEFSAVDRYETSQATVVNTPDLKQKVIFYQGPQGFASKIGKDLTSNAIKSQRVHFCTGEPDYYIHILGIIRGEGPSIAIDPAQEVYRLWPREKLDKALSMSDSLFCNAFEAKIIEDRLGLSSVFDVDKSLVVRTDGADGSTAKIGEDIVKIPCIKGECTADPTGCGDSYRAGFYSGLYHGYSVRDSLVLASAVSSFTIEKVGALSNTPKWDQVEERAAPYLK